MQSPREKFEPANYTSGNTQSGSAQSNSGQQLNNEADSTEKSKADSTEKSKAVEMLSVKKLRGIDR